MANVAKDMIKEHSKNYDYEKIASNPKFKNLMSQKKKFLVPATIFFLAFYFALPVLTSYSTILNTPAIGSITWTWIFALAQFVMTWTLCMMYVRKATRFDEIADEIVNEAKEGSK